MIIDNTRPFVARVVATTRFFVAKQVATVVATYVKQWSNVGRDIVRQWSRPFCSAWYVEWQSSMVMVVCVEGPNFAPPHHNLTTKHISLYTPMVRFGHFATFLAK